MSILKDFEYISISALNELIKYYGYNIRIKNHHDLHIVCGIDYFYYVYENIVIEYINSLDAEKFNMISEELSLKNPSKFELRVTLLEKYVLIQPQI